METHNTIFHGKKYRITGKPNIATDKYPVVSVWIESVNVGGHWRVMPYSLRSYTVAMITRNRISSSLGLAPGTDEIAR